MDAEERGSGNPGIPDDKSISKKNYAHGSGKSERLSQASKNSLERRQLLEAEIEAVENLANTKQRLAEEKAIIEQERIRETLRLKRSLLASSSRGSSVASASGKSERGRERSEVSEKQRNANRGVPERVADWVRDQTDTVRGPRVAVQAHDSRCPRPDINLGSPLYAPKECLLARKAFGKQLPDFSGDPLEYLNFYSFFIRSSEACAYSEEENVARLQKCLKGKAREAVKALLPFPNCLHQILNTLKMRFGRPEFVIKRLMEVACTTPVLREEKLEALLDFATTVQNLVVTLNALESQAYLQNPQLLEELLTRIPVRWKVQWGEFMVDNGWETATLTQFNEWMQRKARALSLIAAPPTTSSTANTQGGVTSGMKSRTVMTVMDPKQSKEDGQKELQVKKEESCNYCRGTHKIRQCDKFKELNIEARWKWVTTENRCFSCFLQGHRSSKCKKAVICGKNGCRRRHHVLLHNYTATENSSAKEKPTTQLVACGTMTEEKTLEGDTAGGKILLRVVPVTLHGPRGEMDTFALLDDGASLTMCQAAIAEELGATGVKRPVELQWMNGMTCEQVSEIVKFEISARGVDRKRYMLKAVRAIPNLSLPEQSFNPNSQSLQQKKFSHINFSVLNQAKPTVIIGQDNWPLLVPLQVIEGDWNGPAATKTRLGWTIHGKVGRIPVQPSRNRIYYFTDNRESMDNNLEQLVERAFNLEVLGVVGDKPHWSAEDERAMQINKDTTKRVDGRWETGLLWKSDDIVMPESKAAAYCRLRSVERKLDLDPILAEQYCAKINDYVTKGYARRLSEEEAATRGDKTWYLPHLAVFNPNKPGKIRVCFDASAKVKGISLNNQLLTGPDIFNSILSILWTFRLGAIAFSSDIQEMYPQILIRKEDQDAQRFLWRGMERCKKPEELVMSSMMFGTVCSPYSAQRVKNINAMEYKEDYPEAVDAILHKHYMDDYLDSTGTEEEALERIRQVTYIHGKGGFKMHSWICNSRKVMEIMAEAPGESASKDIGQQELTPSGRVLGLWWNPNTDTLNFELRWSRISGMTSIDTAKPTKREVLRVTMAIFDPLGFLAHVMIQAKILFQRIWRTTTEWDQPIDDQLFSLWQRWVEIMNGCCQQQIPRCYSPYLLGSPRVELHTFCDASAEGYAAVSYLRLETPHGYEVAFVSAKARVAPAKVVSIPRLELQAALLGARLADTLRKELAVGIRSSILWSDSRAVLCWLRNGAHRYKAFVAHRVAEIEELTRKDTWQWVPTMLNVADLATKIQAITPEVEVLWLRGPDFLRAEKDEWPVEDNLVNMSEEEEVRKEVILTAVEKEPKVEMPVEIGRYSSWLRLIRVTARLHQFTEIASHRRKTGELTPEDIHWAEKVWWKKTQQDSFAKELKVIKAGNELPRNSKLVQYAPFVDAEGVLRMDSRINRAEQVPMVVLKPVILDPKHEYTRLVVMHQHVLAGHHGQEYVANELRQKFCIPQLKRAVRSAWNRCIRCRIQRAAPKPPMMAPLPKERLEHHIRPFTCLGMDYFGPLEITIGRRHEKRYGVIFTCFATRAVHLEVAHSLSTDAAIMAIRRMISRRGTPREIWSDNGTNLRGADKELRRALEGLDTPRITTEMTNRGIDWKFIPPAAPHFGGGWERLVQSVKVALRATLKEKFPRDEVLRTLFAEAEHIVNSRPLTQVPLDNREAPCLTPNHFLLGSSSGAAPPGKFSDEEFNHRRQWRIAERLTDHFWMRWVREYLPTLARRTKWHQQQAPIKVGDLVIVADRLAARNQWSRGIVTRTFPGADGQVRTAEVKTVMGHFLRPATGLCVLDVARAENVA